MRNVIRSMAKEGKDINEILDMPFHFFVDILQDQAKGVEVIDDEAETERILDRM